MTLPHQLKAGPSPGSVICTELGGPNRTEIDREQSDHSMISSANLLYSARKREAKAR